MFADKGVLKIIKGFKSFEKFYRKYRRYENEYPESDFVIHFRIATHGDISQTNCHPFYVNQNVGFAHNGILSCVEVPKNSVLSDTQIFCRQVLKTFPTDFLNRPEYRKLLKFIAEKENSKFVFMTNENDICICNESAGEWIDGCWYSNRENKKPKWWYDKSFSYKEKDICIVNNEEWRECFYCGDYLPESEMLLQNDEHYVCPECEEESEYYFKPTSKKVR
jgi:glutamine amidotransferase